MKTSPRLPENSTSQHRCCSCRLMYRVTRPHALTGTRDRVVKTSQLFALARFKSGMTIGCFPNT